MLDDALEIVTWALATAGPRTRTRSTKENLAKVRPVLAKWLPLVKVYDSDSPKTALLNGDVDLGIVWSGEAAILIKESRRSSSTCCRRRARTCSSTASRSRRARRTSTAAHKFIDYILRPEVSKMISEEFPYTNPNLEARKLLTPEERANPASYPPGNPKLETFRDIGAARGRRRQAVHRPEGEERS